MIEPEIVQKEAFNGRRDGDALHRRAVAGRE